jgi:CheY-like chemotaxis protein
VVRFRGGTAVPGICSALRHDAGRSVMFRGKDEAIAAGATVANVFLVEDDLAYLYVAKRVLERLGHSVTSYESSFRAWDAITAGASFDLLLVDLRFPPGQPNGVALALYARIQNSGLPVVFMTAHEELLDKVEADLGPVLLKSIPPMELGAAVENALAKRLQTEDER